MIHGVYGLHSLFRHNEITYLLERLKRLGLPTLEFKYLKLFAIHTYSSHALRRFALNLKERLKSGDSIVAHSFGCAIVWKLLEILDEEKSALQLNKIYLLNSALNREYTLKVDHCQHIYVFHDPSDFMLKLATYLPFNIMGDMGKAGYQYKDPKITNIEIKGDDELLNHSRSFHGKGLEWSSNLIKRLENE